MKLPPRYASMPDPEVAAAIAQAKARLGESLTILGHHYQRDEVIQFADFRGDSLGLSQRATEAAQARFIVFCGVRFMAETAAMLATPEQLVVQPVAEALCPMARMADAGDVAQAWTALSGVWDGDLVPLTYQNSTADLKAFVGEHGGAVCTSSNAGRLFEWALSRSGHILFTPDEHLGTNTALAMGIPPKEIGIWDPAHPPDPHSLASCRVVVWKGFCRVHTNFTPQDVRQARDGCPDGLVVVHPECVHEVVALADSSGSTTGIIRFVQQAPAGSTVFIGTEWHLVNRLSQEHRDKTVLPLRRSVCAAMSMTSMKHLLFALDSILEGNPRNIVVVEERIAEAARVALERMLVVS